MKAVVDVSLIDD